jgi:hypothetical protein
MAKWGRLLTGMLVMWVAAAGCRGENNRAPNITRAPTAVASKPRPAPTHPSLANHGTNYRTITRSLLAYDRWAFASHPDPALVNRYIAPGGVLFNNRKTWFASLRVRHRRVVERYIGRPTFSVIDSHFGDFVSLRVVENVVRQALVDQHGHTIDEVRYRQPTAYLVVITRGFRGRWYLVSLELAPKRPNVQLTAMTPSGDVAGNKVEVGITYTTPGTVGTTQRPEPRPLFTVRYIADAEFLPIDVRGLCTTDAGKPGYRYVRLTSDIAGRLVARSHVCLAVGPDAPLVIDDEAAHAPTIEEVWRATQLPTPHVTIDPPTRGVTGLSTRIQAYSENRAVIRADLHGYTVIGTATLDHVRTVVDGRTVTDGASTVNSTYQFETRGVHTIAVRADWRAHALVSGPSASEQLTFDLGSATIMVTRSYSVSEIRAVLQLFSADTLPAAKDHA